jgi:hypothetical protein
MYFQELLRNELQATWARFDSGSRTDPLKWRETENNNLIVIIESFIINVLIQH